jgi:hypothetical protein
MAPRDPRDLFNGQPRVDADDDQLDRALRQMNRVEETGQERYSHMISNDKIPSSP